MGAETSLPLQCCSLDLDFLCLQSLILCYHAGTARADWAAPAHAKRQATPTRTPARAPKKPHAMAVAAAKRAQMRQLDSTPPRHLLSHDPADRVITPAKRALCSSAVNAEHSNAKRLHSMNAGTPGRAPGNRFSSAAGCGPDLCQQPQQEGGEYGLEDAPQRSLGSIGSQLPIRPQTLGRVGSHASPYADSVEQHSFNRQLGGNTAPFRGNTRATVFGRNQARQPGRGMSNVQQQPSSTGTTAGLQLCTPLRPNSAGSALRGFVPPDHRFASCS